MWKTCTSGKKKSKEWILKTFVALLQDKKPVKVRNKFYIQMPLVGENSYESEYQMYTLRIIQ